MKNIDNHDWYDELYNYKSLFDKVKYIILQFNNRQFTVRNIHNILIEYYPSTLYRTVDIYIGKLLRTNVIRKTKLEFPYKFKLNSVNELYTVATTTKDTIKEYFKNSLHLTLQTFLDVRNRLLSIEDVIQHINGNYNRLFKYKTIHSHINDLIRLKILIQHKCEDNKYRYEVTNINLITQFDFYKLTQSQILNVFFRMTEIGEELNNNSTKNLIIKEINNEYDQLKLEIEILRKENKELIDKLKMINNIIKE